MKNTRPVIDPRGQFTFVMIPRWILRSKLSFGAKCLYGIAMSMHARSSEHWPTAKEIADELGICERSIGRYVLELRDSGTISTHRKAHALRFLFHWHEWIEKQDIRDEQQKKEKSKTGTNVGENMVLPFMDTDQTICPITEPAKPPPRSDTSVVCDRTYVSDVSLIKRDHREIIKRETKSPQPKAFGEFEFESQSSAPTPAVLRSLGETDDLGFEEDDGAQQELFDDSSRLERARQLTEAVAARSTEAKARTKRRKAAAWDARRRHEPAYRAPEELYDVWAEECERARPGVPVARWRPKREMSHLKGLTDRYDGQTVELLFRYVIRNWEAIKRRFFKGEGGPTPSLASLIRFHDSWVPEASQWSSVVQVLEEYEQWKANKGPGLVIPDSDLMNRYEHARKELEGLRLDI